MRKRSLTAIPLVIIALVGAACGGVTSPGGSGNGSTSGGDITHPTGADELVLRVQSGGGFVPVEYNLSGMPSFSMYGDGLILTQGPMIEIYPPPAVPSILQQRVDEAGMQAILAAAEEAGLFVNHNYDAMMQYVMDVGSTGFIVNADGTTYESSVYGLGMAQDFETDIPQADITADKEFSEFNQSLYDLSTWLPEGSLTPYDSEYVPTEMRIYVRLYGKPTDPSMEQKPMDWPLSTPLSNITDPPRGGTAVDYSCGTVERADMEELLPVAQTSNTETPWVSEGKEYRVIFRPLLPDESGC